VPPLDPAPSPGVVFPSTPVVSGPRSGSDCEAGEGVVDRCWRSTDPDDVDDDSSVVLTSQRPASEATPSDDDE